MAKLDLSLTDDELGDYLARERTIRLATATPAGEPHVVPLWYVWVDGVIFMNTTLGNVTVRNLEANPQATGTVDDGQTYDELRGVLLHGRVERAEDDPRLPAVTDAWSHKYMGGNPVPYGRWRDRIWLRLRPDGIASWDFRKIPEARARVRERQE
jgi:nitroimidazol reductase NimA-like FMN-containing flavoprotein (pyridoxamine 5'-phosphate oxidase superfamily)